MEIMLVESQGITEAPAQMSERERIVRAVIEELSLIHI